MITFVMLVCKTWVDFLDLMMKKMCRLIVLPLRIILGMGITSSIHVLRWAKVNYDNMKIT
eukprot:scaffold322753_cov28-Attheya_sp.AAC.1